MKAEKLGSSSLKKAAGLFLGTTALYIGGIAANLRDKLPEPYDLPDHMGNVVCGGVAVGWIAAVLGSAASEVARTQYFLADLRDRPSHFRAAVTGGSFVLGVIANGLVETKIGALVNEPDYYDFVYGVVASGIFGAISPGPYNKAFLENLPPPEHQ